ncbi:extra-large guanine nucleotide-binding protein 1-like [Cynara cardunculus var. scolymus]|uniref:extra-large guanine nucleotide-binding protein 1-like n=1 Tax=Cynara cardunculus var. scolymus TaxID=59895 RepID=UPI000D62421C|nr:extra-large guanine nucleotide-binding protein 1-like [Cynara cardunculus var. scolymus]
MPVQGTTMVGLTTEGRVPYSFALEYEGPPIPHHDLPRALPIDIHKIPVAAVLPNSCFSDNLINTTGKPSMPVVQPILASDITTNFAKLGTTQAIISPTSVISFRNEENCNGNDSISKDLETETTVSPAHDGGFEERSSSNRDVFISSGEFLDMINSSAGLGSSSLSHDHSYELSGRGESSGTLGFSDSFGKSRDFSGNSLAFRASNACKESLDFNELNHPDWVSSGSRLSFEYPSSRVSSLKTGDCKEESVCDLRRNNPVITFRDIESEDEDFLEDLSQPEPEIARLKREPEVKTRKGACYRCLKGNRFTEKEVCMVCNAKYCVNCVLRAMGSMPEGRKCVTCIGYSIDESKRDKLGKCSRMLKRLLNSLEVRQIMKAEKLCAVNQLPSEYVCVNGKPLCHEELAILQSCPNPPKKLKPGNYWYDKVSGLWGKEGEKPSKIISPHLNVGAPILSDASNGNTGVFINGREITKVELRMLQLSGVQCAGNPHFWVNDDGSYQEEGQKNTRGYIWGKAGTKLVCAVLSLPVPSKSIYPTGEQLSNTLGQSVPDYFDQSLPQKLLLIGCGGSGTSTIFKQAKILYKEIPFTEEERENIRFIIQSNVYGYLGILLEGRERFEDEAYNEMKKNQSSDTSGSTGADDEKTIYSICPRLKMFSDWLLKTMVAGNLEDIFPAATREYAPVVEELWNHPAMQATYKRRSELDTLPSVSSYFLEQAVNILRADYIPSDVDILYAEHVTSSNGLSCVNFSFPQLSPDESNDTADQHNSLLRFQLIRVQARGLGENCKWLDMFEDVRVVIFCVSLSDFDQYAEDGDGNLVNKMLLNRKFFKSIVTHPTYDQMEFLLVLNKFDVFEERLERVPLTCCEWFGDFRPIVSRNSHNKNISSTNINHSPSMGQMASHYVAVKFKKLYSSLTGRKLFVSVVKGLEPNSVDQCLKYAKEIQKWDEEKPNFSLNEYSMYSTEASSSSE